MIAISYSRDLIQKYIEFGLFQSYILEGGGTYSSLDFLGHIFLFGDLLEFGLSWRSSVFWSGLLTVPPGLPRPLKLYVLNTTK